MCAGYCSGAFGTSVLSLCISGLAESMASLHMYIPSPGDALLCLESFQVFRDIKNNYQL